SVSTVESGDLATWTVGLQIGLGTNPKTREHSRAYTRHPPSAPPPNPCQSPPLLLCCRSGRRSFLSPRGGPPFLPCAGRRCPLRPPLLFSPRAVQLVTGGTRLDVNEVIGAGDDARREVAAASPLPVPGAGPSFSSPRRGRPPASRPEGTMRWLELRMGSRNRRDDCGCRGQRSGSPFAHHDAVRSPTTPSNYSSHGDWFYTEEGRAHQSLEADHHSSIGLVQRSSTFPKPPLLCI
ncbi:unnamed protein product, partial [Urochloa humidicola]